IAIEDVEIDEEVDVIVSEWMGYMLLYEVKSYHKATAVLVRNHGEAIEKVIEVAATVHHLFEKELVSVHIVYVVAQRGNKPTSNSQFYSNRRTSLHFAHFAKIYKAWNFYRIQRVKAQ
ncbi:alpha-xylosidase 2, partial [Olea europaea subsp. europaea]